MNVLPRSLAAAVVLFLTSCAGTQSGQEAAAPISEDQIRLTVVNGFDGPVDVYYLWENRSSRARLGSVSIGREADFGVPWVGGYLRVTFESSLLDRTVTSNALELSQATPNVDLIVTINWSSHAILKIRE